MPMFCYNVAHMDSTRGNVAVIGAGPAGLFAAREISQAGYRVALLNRDIKPGGLAEYGIYPDKKKMKDGLRAQFNQILATPNLTYYGNVAIGKGRDLELQELAEAGFDAVLVCTGAQENRKLGLPGEDLPGVYHANDLVYTFTGMPPFGSRQLEIGKNAAVIGVGNVMTDIACYLIRDMKVDTITVVARRGPLEVKFEKKEFERIAANLALDDLEQQMKEVEPLMLSLGQDPGKGREMFYSCLLKAEPKMSDTRLHVRFLSSPARFISDAQGRLAGVELVKNTLIMEEGKLKAIATQESYTMQADTVVLAIGNKVDDQFGLPVVRGEFARNPEPKFPVEDLSYEAYDPQLGRPLEGIFLGGWARKASDGLVGKARKDGVNSARAVLQYLQSRDLQKKDSVAWLEERLVLLDHPVVRLNDLGVLQAAEKAKADELGVGKFLFKTNGEMLSSMGLIKETPAQ